MVKSKQTKSSLISSVYENSTLDLNDVSTCVSMFVMALTEALGRGETVELRGLGTFEVKQHDGRRGLNFSTGEVRKNDNYRAVLFRPGKALKEKLRGEYNEKDS